MSQEMDIAREPVDLSSDDEYMDTGVLHDGRVCTKCQDRAAKAGHTMCVVCLRGTGKD